MAGAERAARDRRRWLNSAVMLRRDQHLRIVGGGLLCFAGKAQDNSRYRSWSQYDKAIADLHGATTALADILPGTRGTVHFPNMTGKETL